LRKVNLGLKSLPALSLLLRLRAFLPASFLEASIVAETRAGDRGLRQFDHFMRESGLAVEAVTHEHALIAREGFSNYGKGRHPAGLNFGDCFAYALAKSTGEPLLFKGEDFRQTDVVPAL